METREIKGQAWISGESLVQDVIVVVPGVDSFSNTVCLVDNIWTDLLSASGKYKTNGKGYFYWEYQQATVDNPDVEITIYFECPRPKDGLFSEPYDPESVEGDYAKYWVSRFKATQENAKNLTIQKKEIIFPESEVYNWKTGSYDKTEKKIIENDDLGPIDNLLTLY